MLNKVYVKQKQQRLEVLTITKSEEKIEKGKTN